jgi:hypothetical protein
MSERDPVPVRPAGGAGEAGGDALRAFVASTRGLGRVQVPLEPEVSAAFRLVALLNLLVGGWAATVLAERWPCSGVLCRLSSLGGRPALLLALTGGCLLVMLALAVPTGGMSRAGGGQLAALTLASTVGAGAVLGAVLAVVLTAVAAALIAVVVIALFEHS